MEATFNTGYGSTSKTVKVEHTYRSVRFTLTFENGNDSVEFELPNYQLLAVLKVYNQMEENNR